MARGTPGLQALSFVLPSRMQCDFDLDNVEKGWLNSVPFIGMIIGGLGIGEFSDRCGRRPACIMALLIHGAAGVCSAIIPSTGFGWFLALRLVVGIGVGGCIPVVYAHLAELSPASHRGLMLVALSSFFMIGQIVSAGLAWGIIGPPDNQSFLTR